MKLTIKQLRAIIKEEVMNSSELYTDLENNPSYNEGWDWARASLSRGMSSFSIPYEANIRSKKMDDPDAFYQGVLDSLAAAGV